MQNKYNQFKTDFDYNDTYTFFTENGNVGYSLKNNFYTVAEFWLFFDRYHFHLLSLKKDNTGKIAHLEAVILFLKNVYYKTNADIINKPVLSYVLFQIDIEITYFTNLLYLIKD